jgi:hypothetical protein
MTKIGLDPRPLDYIESDAIERILDAVGTEVTSSALDKEDLAAELGWLVAVYRGRVVGADRGLATDRTRRMTNIRNAARQIIGALNKDIWSLISSTRANRANPYREELHATMERLIENIGDWFDPPDRVPSPPGSTWGARRSRSPFEELVGDIAKLFKKQFGLEATFHRRASDHAPDSPFIRFVEQVLEEFKITHQRRTYSRETIAKALSDERTGRTRSTK